MSCVFAGVFHEPTVVLVRPVFGKKDNKPAFLLFFSHSQPHGSALSRLDNYAKPCGVVSQHIFDISEYKNLYYISKTSRNREHASSKADTFIPFKVVRGSFGGWGVC